MEITIESTVFICFDNVALKLTRNFDATGFPIPKLWQNNSF